MWLQLRGFYRRILREFASFYKGIMKGVKDVVSCRIPKAISLQVQSVSNENTRD